MKILHLDSSARKAESISRKLAADLLNKIKKDSDEVTYRDISGNIPFVAGIKGAGFIIPEEERTEQDKELFKFSDELVDELLAADTIVISTPIYNFGPPATLKAWSDLAARVKSTFKYSPEGKQIGLLEDKKVYLVITSGGTKIGSKEDYLTPWLKHVLNFFGIKDIHTISADQMSIDYEKSIKQAEEQIEKVSHK